MGESSTSTNHRIPDLDSHLRTIIMGLEGAMTDEGTKVPWTLPPKTRATLVEQAKEHLYTRRKELNVKECWTKDATTTSRGPSSSPLQPSFRTAPMSAVKRFFATPPTTLNMLNWPQRHIPRWSLAGVADEEPVLGKKSPVHMGTKKRRRCVIGLPSNRTSFTFLLGVFAGVFLVVLSLALVDETIDDVEVACGNQNPNAKALRAPAPAIPLIQNGTKENQTSGSGSNNRTPRHIPGSRPGTENDTKNRTSIFHIKNGTVLPGGKVPSNNAKRMGTTQSHIVAPSPTVTMPPAPFSTVRSVTPQASVIVTKDVNGSQVPVDKSSSRRTTTNMGTTQGHRITPDLTVATMAPVPLTTARSVTPLASVTVIEDLNGSRFPSGNSAMGTTQGNIDSPGLTDTTMRPLNTTGSVTPSGTSIAMEDVTESPSARFSTQEVANRKTTKVLNRKRYSTPQPSFSTTTARAGNVNPTVESSPSPEIDPNNPGSTQGHRITPALTVATMAPVPLTTDRSVTPLASVTVMKDLNGSQFPSDKTSSDNSVTMGTTQAKMDSPVLTDTTMPPFITTRSVTPTGTSMEDVTESPTARISIEEVVNRKTTKVLNRKGYSSTPQPPSSTTTARTGNVNPTIEASRSPEIDPNNPGSHNAPSSSPPEYQPHNETEQPSTADVTSTSIPVSKKATSITPGTTASNDKDNNGNDITSKQNFLSTTPSSPFEVTMVTSKHDVLLESGNKPQDENTIRTTTVTRSVTTRPTEVEAMRPDPQKRTATTHQSNDVHENDETHFVGKVGDPLSNSQYVYVGKKKDKRKWWEKLWQAIKIHVDKINPFKT